MANSGPKTLKGERNKFFTGIGTTNDEKVAERLKSRINKDPIKEFEVGVCSAPRRKKDDFF